MKIDLDKIFVVTDNEYMEDNLIMGAFDNEPEAIQCLKDLPDWYDPILMTLANFIQKKSDKIDELKESI